MTIADMTVNTFWKGELGVQGIIADGEQRYPVSLYIKGSQLFDYSCSCMGRAEGKSGGTAPWQRESSDGAVSAAVRYRGLCPHAKLLYEAYRAKAASGSGRPVSTSQEVRAMIRAYTNREVAQLVAANEEQQIRLVPRLLVRNGDTYLEWRVGRERLYVLKDLAAFAQAVENGTYVSYSKKLGFHHSMRAFVPEDRALAAFLVELVNVYREHYEQFRKSAYVTVQGLRELHLSRGNRDRFFALMQGRMLEVERGGRSSLTEVCSRPVQLEVKIRKAGRDGIRVSIDRGLYGFAGENILYVGDDRWLCCLDEAATEALSIFLEQMWKGNGGYQTDVQERDIPLFQERVLKKILPYSRFDVEGVDLAQYHPVELKACFTFDSPRPGEITMQPMLSYGDYSFAPMEDEHVPRTVCRDVPGEFRISQAITKYFKYRGNDARTLIIRDDDDAVYRLLDEGMAEFMELGEVRVSEEAKRLRLVPPPKVQVGVRMDGGWLELSVDAEGMSRAELARILAGYDPKKPYYRLKGGEFLQLTDNGMLAVARMVNGMAVTRTQLQEGNIRIPAYRALYLDSLIKEAPGVSLYRDSLFKAVVRGMKAVEDSDYEIPDCLKPVLRGYQKTGYRWLRTLDAYGFGGILADDMGLGKTIQVIALLQAERDAQTGGLSLIVCPASLIYNWENEFHRFAPELAVTVAAGTAAEREELLRGICAAERPEAQAVETERPAKRPDVLITSYDLLRRDAALYQSIRFRYQVIDEAQYIKNPATQNARSVKSVQAQTRFALTGTPVENHLSELWSIFDYLMPGFLFGYQKFRQTFELPLAHGEDAEALHRLCLLTGPFILRRLKKDVLRDLPDKLETVVYSRAGEEQRKLYVANAVRLKERLEAMDKDDVSGGKLQILAELTRLRQLCCHPSLCYRDYRGGSAKLDTLMELIATGIAGGHKMLLFSQFTSMLDIIRGRLAKEGIACHLLTGDTPKEERVYLASAFQTDDTPLFLISLKAGGTGLNLTAADIVIHYDPWWNVAAQNQATDRAHRIGQQKQVTVYQMILKDSVEENILKLQARKQRLAEQVVTGENLSFADMTREDLLQILDGADVPGQQAGL